MANQPGPSAKTQSLNVDLLARVLEEGRADMVRQQESRLANLKGAAAAAAGRDGLQRELGSLKGKIRESQQSDRESAQKKATQERKAAETQGRAQQQQQAQQQAFRAGEDLLSGSQVQAGGGSSAGAGILSKIAAQGAQNALIGGSAVQQGGGINPNDFGSALGNIAGGGQQPLGIGESRTTSAVVRPDGTVETRSLDEIPRAEQATLRGRERFAQGPRGASNLQDFALRFFLGKTGFFESLTEPTISDSFTQFIDPRQRQKLDNEHKDVALKRVEDQRRLAKDIKGTIPNISEPDAVKLLNAGFSGDIDAYVELNSEMITKYGGQTTQQRQANFDNENNIARAKQNAATFEHTQIAVEREALSLRADIQNATYKSGLTGQQTTNNFIELTTGDSAITDPNEVGWLTRFEKIQAGEAHNSNRVLIAEEQKGLLGSSIVYTAKDIDEAHVLVNSILDTKPGEAREKLITELSSRHPHIEAIEDGAEIVFSARRHNDTPTSKANTAIYVQVLDDIKHTRAMGVKQGRQFVQPRDFPEDVVTETAPDVVRAAPRTAPGVQLGGIRPATRMPPPAQLGVGDRAGLTGRGFDPSAQAPPREVLEGLIEQTRQRRARGPFRR